MKALGISILLATACLLAACDNMADQQAREALEPSGMAERQSSARHPPTGSVKMESPADWAVASGLREGRFVASVPLPVDRAFLEQGQTLFNIYCAVCHGAAGDGDGIVVARGMPQPPAFHEDRLRRAPDGYLYRVISDGYGVMYPYADRLQPSERWQVVAYVRALQLSRHWPDNADEEGTP